MAAGFLKVAASYLLVLHNLEPLEQSSKVGPGPADGAIERNTADSLRVSLQDTVRLLQTAMNAEAWTVSV